MSEILKLEFLKFLNDLSLDREKTLKNNNMYYYFDELIIDTKEKDLIYYKINKQKEFNSIILNELRVFNKAFNEVGIKFILLKGLLLSYELYQKPEIRRSRDIDILVKPEDLRIVCSVLGKLGYHDVKGITPNEQYVDSDYMLSYGNHHMTPFYREINYNNIIEEIWIEIHRSPYPRTKYDFGVSDYSIIDVSELFNRCETVEINGLYLNRLELHDRLIQLMIHFTTHLLNDLRDFVLYMKKPSIELRLLYDMAVFITKNKNKIDYNKIVTLSKKWGYYNDVKLTVKLLNCVFNSIVESSLFEEEIIDKNFESCDYMRRLISYISKIPIKKLITGDLFIEIHKGILNNCLYSSKVYCSQDKETTYMVPRIINDVIEKESPVLMTWDARYLSFKIKGLDISRTLLLDYGERKNNFHIKKVSGIYFNFFNKNINIQKWFCRGYGLLYKDGILSLVNLQKWVFGIENEIVDGSLYNLNYRLNGKQIDINLKLSWELFEMDPFKGTELGLNIIHSNKFDMFDYCTPDRHSLLILS